MSHSQEKTKEPPVLLRISEEDWDKLVQYCKIAKPNEIMGLAHAKIEGKTIRIYKPFILEQEVASATCEVDRKALVKMIGEYEDIKDVRVIWHSHVDMSAFFSTCDRETSDSLSSLGSMIGGNQSWFLSLVLNCRSEYEAKLDMYTPFPAVLDCKMEITIPEGKFAGMKEEVERLCKPKYSTTGYQGQGYTPQGGWQGYREGEVLIRGGKRKGKDKEDKDKQHDSRDYDPDGVFKDIDLYGSWE